MLILNCPVVESNVIKEASQSFPLLFQLIIFLNEEHEHLHVFYLKNPCCFRAFQ